MILHPCSIQIKLHVCHFSVTLLNIIMRFCLNPRFFFTFLRASSKLACSQHSAIFVAEGKRTHQMLLRAILHTYCIAGVIFIRAHRTHATCNLCDPYCVLLITTVQEGCVHARHALKDNTNLLAEVVGVVNDNAALIKLALQNIKCVL